MIKKIFVLMALFFTLCLNKSLAQLSKDLQLINNDSIRFELLHVNIKFVSENAITPSGYQVDVDISNKIKKRLKKLTYDEWLKLLSNDKTDWAANLILYDLFETDAIKLLSINSREEWIKGQKNLDIEYWKKRLK